MKTYKSSVTGNIDVTNWTSYSYRLLAPVLRAVREVAEDLNLTADQVRVSLDTDLPGLRSGYCAPPSETGRACAVIDPECAMYGNDGEEWIDAAKIKKLVAHEMRHAWQYVTGILKHVEEKREWNGQIVCNYIVENIMDDAEYQAYLDLPWERDARQYAGDNDE